MEFRSSFGMLVSKYFKLNPSSYGITYFACSPHIDPRSLEFKIMHAAYTGDVSSFEGNNIYLVCSNILLIFSSTCDVDCCYS
jgi:hypothetical protein